MVVLSVSGLATIGSDINYTTAVQNANFAIPDSAYMALLVKILKGTKINKLNILN